MGGRGGTSKVGSGEKSRSENIKNEMLNAGLSSNIAGIRKKAEQGIGNYSFKDAKAVSAKQFEESGTYIKIHERNGNTLLEGFLKNGKHVYYANKSDSAEIKKVLDERKRKKERQSDTTLRRPDYTGKTTTTYERWRTNNSRKFEEWYGVDKIKEVEKKLGRKKK